MRCATRVGLSSAVAATSSSLTAPNEKGVTSREVFSPPREGEKTLLGYPLRRAAAFEMLYGGVRVRHLVQPAFPLKKTFSELLPAPSLERERADLGLEMQLPLHRDASRLPSLNVQRQVSGAYDEPKESTQDGFSMAEYFNTHLHPAHHHNSSLPYDAVHDTNNVLALRLFPVNIGIRDRTEAIRIRTRDCLDRLQQLKLCARLGVPVEYPIALRAQDEMRRKVTALETAGRPRSLYSGAVNPDTRHTAETLPQGGSTSSSAPSLPSFLPHMKRICFHPPPASLSIFTRPQQVAESRGPRKPCTRQEKVCGSWMPLQMLKPMGYNWSPGRRSSGMRGPTAQLVQERLDQKGFGWKRKSRYLWQQDIHTAGFRPHRFY